MTLSTKSPIWYKVGNEDDVFTILQGYCHNIGLSFVWFLILDGVRYYVCRFFG